MSALPNIPPQGHEPRDTSRSRAAVHWQRVLLWIFGSLLTLALVLVVAIAVLLHSHRFHQYVLAKAQQTATENLNVPVELQEYTLQFSGISPTLDLYGIVVHGAAPYANPPLLQARHGRIGVRIVSLLSRKWYLSDITIDQPIVQLRVDANGNNNLPKPKQTSSSNNNGIQTLFDLAIRHAAINQGAVFYNNRQSALDADLHDLALNAGYNASANTYTGQLSYDNGHLKSGAYAPITHALSAEFAMTPTHFDLRRAELRSGNSTVNLTASVEDFNNPRVNSEYRATINATDFRRILNNPNVPSGVLQLNGKADYTSIPNQPALNSAVLTGTLSSDRLELITPAGRAEARVIKATYSLKNGNAEISSFSASLLGGTVRGDASVKNVAANQDGIAHLTLNDISLSDLKQLAGSSAPNTVTLSGTLQARTEATWKGSPNNLIATAAASLDAAAGSTQSSNTVPLTAQIHGTYRNPNQQLTLTQSYLRTPQTVLTLDGTAGRTAQMNIALNAADLHELESITSIFAKPSQPLNLYGNAGFRGTLSGSTSAPHLVGDLNAANLRLRGSDFTSLRAHLDASPSLAQINNGQLVPARTGNAPASNIAFSGRATLKQWSFSANSPFQLNVNAQKLNVAQLAKLSGSTATVGGTLDLNLQAHGTELNPIGQGTLQLTKATIAGESVPSATVQFNGDGNAAHANVNITMPAGNTNGVVTYYPKQRGYEVNLQTRNFRLDQLQSIKAHNLSISGVMNLVASGRGTLDDPQLTASLDIPKLQAQGQTIENLALKADVAQHLANVTLSTRAVNSNINGRAKIQLTGDYQADAVIDTQPIPLQPLVATYAPSQAENITGQTELHATLRGPLKHRDQIEAHLVIPQLSAKYQNSIQLAASGPIRADYTDGVLKVERSGIKGTGADLQFQGSIPVLDRTKPLALLLLGSVDLRLAQLFTPDVTSSGELRFNINSYGARSDPNIQGDVKIVNANFATADAPLGLSNGNGTLQLTRDRLNITQFEGTVGGGKVTARGGVLYHPSIQFDLALSGQGIRLLYPEGVREGVSANLTLTGTTDRADLRGQINVDQLSFTPDFDISTLTSLSSGVEEPPSRGFASNLQLNVALRSTQNIALTSRTISVNGSANLRLTGTAAEPVVLGRVNLTGGDLVFQGNRYILQSGVIDFINPTRTEPNVNASITTTIQQYNIGMRFEGPVDRLRTSYSSDPALPPADIINLIAFGKTQEAAAADTTPASQTAEQSIASAVSGQVTSRVQKIAGISHLSVDPTLGNNQQNAGATVTIQQRVTSKIFVTFSTDVTSTQRQVIQLQYQATPRVSVSGTRDQNGGFGFDTRITREW